MRQLGIFCVVLLGLLSFGGAPLVHDPKLDNRWRVMAPQMTHEKIARLQHTALDGSWEAAAELQNIYSYSYQERESIFWGMIAIENGKQSAPRYNLALTLAASTNPLHQRRARFLLKQIIEEKGEHSGLAKSLIKDMDEGHQMMSPFPDRYPKW